MRTRAVAVMFVAIATAHAARPVRVAHADVGGLGVLPLGAAPELVDAAYAHATASDAVAIIAGARLRIASGFLDGELPVVWQDHGAFALGNVTVRAGLAIPALQIAALSLRVSMPTAPSEGGGGSAAAAMGVPRVADGELFLPDTTSIELMGDWRWQRTAWWLQAEAGVAGWWQPAGSQSVLRASVAGGVPVAPWLDLAASLVTRSYLLDHDPAEDFVHTLMLGLIAHTAAGELAVRLEVPIDSSARVDDRFVVGVELRAY